MLRGLRTVHSVSRPGVSEVTLEFDWGADMDLLLLDVREKLDRLILPEEAEDPVVLRFDPSLDPILRIALGGTGDLTESRRLADRRLKQAFESIKGVASARIKGGLEEEIHVEVDQERLAALGIPLERVRQVVGVSNVNLPGGSLRGTDTQYLIRTVNEYTSVEEIGGLVLSAAGASQIRVARRGRGAAGAPANAKRSSASAGSRRWRSPSTRRATPTSSPPRVRSAKRLPEMTKLVPEGYELTVLFDQSRFIEQALVEVRFTAVVGGVLAILVLFVFLRDTRSTVIIATAIPLSVLFAFMAMYRLDVSLNIMSLGGLTLGIGMLVDNAIVVLESIHRKRQEGLGRDRGGHRGHHRGRRRGGGLDPDHGRGLSAHHLCRGHRRRALRRHGHHRHPEPARLAGGRRHPDPHAQRPRRRRRTAGGARLEPRPREPGLGRSPPVFTTRCSAAALRRRWLTIAAAAVVFALAVAGVARLQTALIPDISQGEFYFEATLPEGTSVEATDRVLQQMTAPIEGDPEVAVAYATAGSRLVSGGLSLSTTAEHYGQLNVVLADRKRRERRTTGGQSTARGLRRHPRARHHLRQTHLLQPQDPHRGHPLLRRSRGALRLGAGARRQARGRSRSGGCPLLARGGQPRAPDHLRPRPVGLPRVSTCGWSPRPCAIGFWDRCPPASARPTARSTSGCATASNSARPATTSAIW